MLGAPYCCSLAAVVPRKTETELSEYKCLSDNNIVVWTSFKNRSLFIVDKCEFFCLYEVYINLLEWCFHNQVKVSVDCEVPAVFWDITTCCSVQ